MLVRVGNETRWMDGRKESVATEGKWNRADIQWGMKEMLLC
jgi:hypothetical protein